MEPAHAAREDFFPVEVARFETRRRLVRAVVEDDGRANAEAPVAIDGGHVRPRHAVVLERLVERPHAHRAHALTDEVADGVVDHRRDYSSLHAEAVREVGRAVELAAADVNLALGRLAEGDDARINPVHERAERDEVERTAGKKVQTVFHYCSPRDCGPLSYAAEGREAAVHGHDYPCDEAGGRRQKP